MLNRSAAQPSRVSRTRLESALEALPDRDRLVLTLLLVERMSPIETAGALRLSVRHVERTYEEMVVSLRLQMSRTKRAIRTRRVA